MFKSKMISHYFPQFFIKFVFGLKCLTVKLHLTLKACIHLKQILYVIFLHINYIFRNKPVYKPFHIKDEFSPCKK